MTNYTSKSIVLKFTQNLTEDDIDQRWLDWADAECDSLLPEGMTFRDSGEETLLIDGPGDTTLILPKKPIIEISSLKCDGVEIVDDLEDSFAIYNNEGIIKVKEGLNISYHGLEVVFAKGTQNIEVTGIFGYGDVPKLVERLSTLLVLNLVRTKTGEDNVKSEKIGDYTISYLDNKDNITSLERSIEDLKIKVKNLYGDVEYGAA